MSNKKNYDEFPPEKEERDRSSTSRTVATSDVSSVTGTNTKGQRQSSSQSERQIKFERAQKCLENAALVSKRIKEHRKATAELLGKPFDDDDDNVSEMASTMSERTSYSAATDISTTLSVQDALNIPGISESLANTLKQKEILMERIKQYKELSKKPMPKSTLKRESISSIGAKTTDNIELQGALKEKENVISILQLKMKSMETTMLDLEEKITEKDMVIEAKTKAISLMSENLSKKDIESDLLENTRQEMIKMHDNFFKLQLEWETEKQNLIQEIQMKDKKIVDLEHRIIEITFTQTKFTEQLEAKALEISNLEEQLKKLSLSAEKEIEEKGSLEIADMEELSKKIEFLESLNSEIRQRNKEVEIQLSRLNQESKPSTSQSPKKSSPLPSRKGGRNTAAKAKSPWTSLAESSTQESDKKSISEACKIDEVVKSLNKDILDKEYLINQKNALISKLETNLLEKDTIIKNLQLEITEKSQNTAIKFMKESTISHQEVHKDIGAEGSSGHDSDPIDTEQNIAEKLTIAQNQIVELNNEIETANKNMIKVKSNHKLKLKQLQKTIDNFTKMSDANTEINKLNQEVHELTQKVAELEEEKGNLQLHLVDYDSGRMTESESYRKMMDMKNLAEARLRAISTLEAQKFDLVQEIHDLRQQNIEMEDKLADIAEMHSDQVSSEIQSAQLEEQLDELLVNKEELEGVINALKADKYELEESVKILNLEKHDIMQKMEHYIQENIELAEKLDKLSTEKVSSAESIEIVESLTTQEKLEIEEYNKGIGSKQSDEKENVYGIQHPEITESLPKLIEESAELSRKIELFTLERQEVMEKMNKINMENEILQNKILVISDKSNILESELKLLQDQKTELLSLNTELNNQIDELKKEQLDVLRSASNLNKPIAVDDNNPLELLQEDKSAGGSKVKSTKQLTKDILKLKNTIKEREAEIADCQMKILSLEEQQQKHSELIKSIADYEEKLKLITDDRNRLNDQLSYLKQESDGNQMTKECNETLQNELKTMKNSHEVALKERDNKVKQMEQLLSDYENKLLSHSVTLQEKDKDITEYVNQITKLNDVSQKLRSTIELLEEEKAKDQNTELIKSLNKQVTVYQKTLSEYEAKIKLYEEEKAHLISAKTQIEKVNEAIDMELKTLRENYVVKQSLVDELQQQQKNHNDELSVAVLQIKERDEEIHAVKLQLRKESIENEKLRSDLMASKDELEASSKEMSVIRGKLDLINIEKNDEQSSLESKNKELLEKLKKFAFNLKKKNNICVDLENLVTEFKKKLTEKDQEIEDLLGKNKDTQVSHDEFVSITQQLSLLTQTNEEKSQHIDRLQSTQKELEEQLYLFTQNVSDLNNRLREADEEYNKLKTHTHLLQNKILEYEEQLKTNIHLNTKIASLEAETTQQKLEIADLLKKVQHQEESYIKAQNGFEAKIQEKDLYIENLQTEISTINVYRNRICRLEESISTMEDRRYSLERKADQLDNELLEKHKAYDEYSNQEDALINRLAKLMDHDKVVEKRLHEIEKENSELHLKIEQYNEEIEKLKKCLLDSHSQIETLEIKANKSDELQNELLQSKENMRDHEIHVKKVMNEYQVSIAKNKKDIEQIESEFNLQIEKAITEKKFLSENCEKLNETVHILESKLQEYSDANQTLNVNLEEMYKINAELQHKSNITSSQQTDYTEQYISEINRLNSIVNSKVLETNNLNDTMKTMQVFYDNKLQVLEDKLMSATQEIYSMSSSLAAEKEKNADLERIVFDRENELKLLTDKKTVSFEMNIPKTEGLIISSTIEQLHTGSSKELSLPDLQSQIISYVHKTEPIKIPKDKDFTDSYDKDIDSKESAEPLIVPKKAYLCYETEIQEEKPITEDVFCSDEGWGLGEGISEQDIIVPGVTQLHDKINELTNQNALLKKDIQSSQEKSKKAFKLLKDLKSSNELLTNELKLSKNIAQNSFLDNAIEDELRINVQELERKVTVLLEDLKKEKSVNEAIRKQNEVLGSANERLIEMKEKLDNEIELWKFKFKDINDKFSLTQTHDATKPNVTPAIYDKVSPKSDVGIREDLTKLEQENDELQNTVDQLIEENKRLSTEQLKLKEEIVSLKDIAKTKKEVICYNCDVLNKRIKELETKNCDLTVRNEDLNSELIKISSSSTELKEQLDIIHMEKCSLESTNLAILNEQKVLMTKNEELISSLNEAYNKRKILDSSIEKLKEEYMQSTKMINSAETLQITEKYNSLNTYNEQLIAELQTARETITSLDNEIKGCNEKLSEYKSQLIEVEGKVENLNLENDQLLSTVAELRSSITSAVDQRGFEIAEMWKQHLAQKEVDFSVVEQDLRNLLSESQNKYDQLLKDVQSSNQDDATKLAILEQLNVSNNSLKEKNDHIMQLQQKLEDAGHELEIFRSEVENEKLLHENKLLTQQEEYEKQIAELSVNFKKETAELKQKLDNLKIELSSTKDANHYLNSETDEMKIVIQNLTDKVNDLNEEILRKNDEIHQKAQDYTISLSERNKEFESVRQQLIEYEKKVEEVTFEKDSELATLRLKRHDDKTYFESSEKELVNEKHEVIEALKDKLTECAALNKTITDLNIILQEKTTSISEMQTALENQEYEIVSLKDDIVNLQDLLKASTNKIERHVTFASDTKLAPDDTTDEGVNKELYDAVPRAELDLALYMLHQRDVRCEELTMELTQLLEERDTLQLRLSDSLRSYEELKLRGVTDADTLTVDIPVEVPSSRMDRLPVNVHGQTSRSSSVSEADDKPILQAKLSELRSVRHSRDVRLRQDSEQRQMGLRLMQRDVANLPPEAAEQLRQAHYTLSRDSQSTSTVLLNWLRGKTTPKVEHM